MKFSIAIAISVGIHVLLGIGLWLYMEYAPAPDVAVSLGLASVELSFAEQEDDTAAVPPQMPTPELPMPEMGNARKPESGVERHPGLPPIPDAVDIQRPEEKPEVNAPSPAPSKPTLAVAPKQGRIDAPPRPERTIRPDYPRGARQRGEQGDVVLEMAVNSEGSVDNAAIATSSGFIELDEAALRAVRAARFVPAKSGGNAVASSARIKLTFKLK